MAAESEEIGIAGDDYCDPTVKLYNWYVCIRNKRVEQLVA
jgi:hypothetical protein